VPKKRVSKKAAVKKAAKKPAKKSAKKTSCKGPIANLASKVNKIEERIDSVGIP
jgi:hypothetical protein